jgi:hypothetical protein
LVWSAIPVMILTILPMSLLLAPMPLMTPDSSLAPDCATFDASSTRRHDLDFVRHGADRGGHLLDGGARLFDGGQQVVSVLRHLFDR